MFGVEGRINQVKLVDGGLYVSRRLGSFHLPTCGRDMYKTRILLERLMNMKKMALINRDHHIKVVNNKAINSKFMNQWQYRDRSPYQNVDDETDRSCWVRGTWFPHTRRNDIQYNGGWPKYLFAPPPLLWELIQLNCIPVLFLTEILSLIKISNNKKKDYKCYRYWYFSLFDPIFFRYVGGVIDTAFSILIRLELKKSISWWRSPIIYLLYFAM